MIRAVICEIWFAKSNLNSKMRRNKRRGETAAGEDSKVSKRHAGESKSGPTLQPLNPKMEGSVLPALRGWENDASVVARLPQETLDCIASLPFSKQGILVEESIFVDALQSSSSSSPSSSIDLTLLDAKDDKPLKPKTALEKVYVIDVEKLHQEVLSKGIEIGLEVLQVCWYFILCGRLPLPTDSANTEETWGIITAEDYLILSANSPQKLWFSKSSEWMSKSPEEVLKAFQEKKAVEKAQQNNPTRSKLASMTQTANAPSGGAASNQSEPDAWDERSDAGFLRWVRDERKAEVRTILNRAKEHLQKIDDPSETEKANVEVEEMVSKFYAGLEDEWNSLDDETRRAYENSSKSQPKSDSEDLTRLLFHENAEQEKLKTEEKQQNEEEVKEEDQEEQEVEDEDIETPE